MDVIRGTRGDFREFIACLCIDILLLFVRLIDRFCGVKEIQGSESIKDNDKKDKNEKQQSKLLILDTEKPTAKQTLIVDKTKTETLFARDRLEVATSSGLVESVKGTARHLDRNISNNSYSLEEVSSSLSESSNDFRRQISALSDYYSSEDDISKEWNTALQEKAIANSLEVARDLENGLIDPENANSAYDAICRGIDELGEVSRRMMENWNVVKDDSGNSLNFGPNRMHQRKISQQNRSADDTCDTVILSPWQKKQSSSEVISVSEAGMNVTDEVLWHQKLNQRMNQECERAGKLQIYLEKKKVELHSKVTDIKWKDLSDGCEVLYTEQIQLLNECKVLSDCLVDRRSDVVKEIGILKSTSAELHNCFCVESEKLKIWEKQKFPECVKFEIVATELRRRFESQKSKFSDADFKALIANTSELQSKHQLLYRKYFVEWNEISQRANDAFRHEYLDSLNHEERFYKWKDFSAVEKFLYKLDSHLKSYNKYVPQICMIHEQRSVWSAGIFGSGTKVSEFDRFYRRYEQKVKAVEEEFAHLQRLQKDCCQAIKIYSQLFEKILDAKEKQHQYDTKLRGEETKMEQMNQRLTEHKEYFAGLFTAKRGNELQDEKIRNYENISAIQHKLDDCFQIIAHCEHSISEIKGIVCMLLDARILCDHRDKCRSLSVDWECRKQYEKLYAIIHQIENFYLVESPDNLKFDDHEDRIVTLEKRLPIIVQLHEENYSECLEIWLAHAADYDRQAQEPIIYDDIVQIYFSCKANCAEVSSQLIDLEKEFRTVVYPNLVIINENLLQLSSQGFETDASEFSLSRCEQLEKCFNEVMEILRNFEQDLADFDALYNPYSEFQIELNELRECLVNEEYDCTRLREKLRECGILLRAHRDHLERRRIRESTDRLSAYMRDILSVLTNNSKKQYEKLFDEQKTLNNDFIGVSKQRLREISELKLHIPRKDLEELSKDLVAFDQKLCNAEERIEKCLQKLVDEENTIHEYWSLVQNLTEFLRDAGKKFDESDSLLGYIDEQLPKYKAFTQKYQSQESSYAVQLRTSKEICDQFSTKFSSALHEFDELRSILGRYGSCYITDESGANFKMTADEELAAILSDLKIVEDTLKDVCKGNSEIEIEISQLLADNKPHLDEILNCTTSIDDELQVQRKVQEMCRSIIKNLEASKTRRDKEADEIKKRLQAENYEEHCKIDDRNPIENEKSFMCPLCSVEIQPLLGITLRDCLHEFCKKCLKKYVKDLKTAEANCPFPRGSSPCCGVILDKEILSLGDDLYEDHTSRGLLEHVRKGRDLVLCWNVKCQRVVAFSDHLPLCDAGEFDCPHCGMRNCKHCKVVHEGKETCDGYQMSLPYRKIAESMKCPVCCNNDISIAFISCGHTCCKECVKQFAKPTQNFPCPFCKKRVQSCLPLYLPFEK